MKLPGSSKDTVEKNSISQPSEVRGFEDGEVKKPILLKSSLSSMQSNDPRGEESGMTNAKGASKQGLEIRREDLTDIETIDTENTKEQAEGENSSKMLPALPDKGEKKGKSSGKTEMPTHNQEELSSVQNQALSAPKKAVSDSPALVPMPDKVTRHEGSEGAVGTQEVKRTAPVSEEDVPADKDESVDGQAKGSTTEEGHSHDHLPFGFARKNRILLNPAGFEPGTIVVTDYTSPTALAEVLRFWRKTAACQLVQEDAFNALITSSYQSEDGKELSQVVGLGEDADLNALAEAVPETADLLEQSDDAPVIRLINAIFAQAMRENASDVHIETFEKNLAVRFRVDGVLKETLKLKRALASLLVSRIKVMSKLDIAEKRLPQDGRIALRMAGREVDIRVSTLPSTNGERVVLRLLDKEAGRLNLSKLGMADEPAKRLRDLLMRPHGILLVTGPTGSGKTTTLYASLMELNDKSRNILTVEDPIEYQLEGISQTQVNTKVDMTFARGLRAILRQDPDVVMVGEIRDKETAEIAVQASLTGHLVFSTLHTNTAVGALNRLLDMGVEPFLLASSLEGVIAQRLVRLLCTHCREMRSPDQAESELLGVEYPYDGKIGSAVGCEECNETGYSGRTGIYEIIALDETLRRMVHDRENEQDITNYAHKSAVSIREDGMQRVLKGETTLEEVLRVTKET